MLDAAVKGYANLKSLDTCHGNFGRLYKDSTEERWKNDPNVEA